MQNQDHGLFKSTTINNNIKFLNIEKGLVYFPNQQIDADAGNNGEIFKGCIGYNTNQQQECCVKKFAIPNYDKLLFEKLDQELLFGRQLVHKNIVKFFECSTSDNNFYIFMEYCNGGSLASKMSLGYEDELMQTKIFPEKEAIYIIQQVIDALVYMKQLSYDGKSGAVHRDIKPDNIMFSNDIPKLIDFGMARFKDKSIVTPYKGSPIYMSPQNLAEDKYDLEKNDVWGIGIILYQLVEGIYPWRMGLNSIEDLKKAQQVIKNKIEFKNNVSAELQNLIRHMLNYEEVDRYNWDQVINNELMKSFFGHLNSLEFNEVKRLVLNCESFEQLKEHFNLQKINKYFIDLTLTKIHQLKKVVQKNSELDKKIEQMYIQRILQKRKYYTFRSERTLKDKLSQAIEKYLQQNVLDNLDELQTKRLETLCKIVIPLYKANIQIENKLSIEGLLQLAKL